MPSSFPASHNYLFNPTPIGTCSCRTGRTTDTPRRTPAGAAATPHPSAALAPATGRTPAGIPRPPLPMRSDREGGTSTASPRACVCSGLPAASLHSTHAPAPTNKFLIVNNTKHLLPTSTARALHHPINHQIAAVETIGSHSR